ncbi:hypothetical protein EI94DRAFT_1679705 [Lactarius quietus]|nr:hypothetical protein EI94DRAFT_1679705 [Lactarius quietus]
MPDNKIPDAKRPQQGGERPKRKRFRSDGTPIWSKRSIDGPGIWVSCVKGKEKQTVGELYDLFESLASELWPETATGPDGASDEDGADDDAETEDLEKQISKELASIKRPRKEQIFANCQTNTPCVIFISCKAPVDPVTLVLKYVEDVETTGVTRTRLAPLHCPLPTSFFHRYTHRLTPVTNTCVANVSEIKSLAQRVLKPFLAQHSGSDFRYKIEIKVRNHNSIPRQTVIDTIVSCVPTEWTVNLNDAEVFILVEVFKSICGIGVVKDYYARQKFNVMEIANSKHAESKLEGDGRVP